MEGYCFPFPKAQLMQVLLVDGEFVVVYLFIA
jgi:hypothetical protein